MAKQISDHHNTFSIVGVPRKLGRMWDKIKYTKLKQKKNCSCCHNRQHYKNRPFCDQQTPISFRGVKQLVAAETRELAGQDNGHACEPVLLRTR